MKKEILFVTSLLAFATLAQANEWEFLPVTGDHYQADFAIALVDGRTKVDNDNDNNDVSTVGAEISLNCPLLKPPHHTIRQQMSYVKTGEQGMETQSLELNPHHMFAKNDKFQAGFGPSLGFTKIKTSAGDDTVFTYGIGGSVRYNITPAVFIAGEARFAKSKDVEIAGVDADYELLRDFIAKTGRILTSKKRLRLDQGFLKPIYVKTHSDERRRFATISSTFIT